MKATLVSFIDSSNIGDRLIAETLSEQLLTGIEIKKYSYKLIEESQVKINKNLVRRSKPHDIYYKYFRQLPLIKNVVSKGKWVGPEEECMTRKIFNALKQRCSNQIS